MEYNNLYVTHKVILANLTRSYKSKQFQEMDIMEWSQEFLNNVSVDIETMVRFIEVGLEVPRTGTQKNMVYAPCNIFRLLDVFDSSGSRIDYYYNGAYITLPDSSTLTAIYLNYIGMPIDEEGTPLIPKNYLLAVETYCKLKAFEEDVALGKFDSGMWQLFDQKVSGYMAAAKNDYRFKDQHALDKLNIIHGNLTPVIANIKLAHKYFE